MFDELRWRYQLWAGKRAIGKCEKLRQSISRMETMVSNSIAKHGSNPFFAGVTIKLNKDKARLMEMDNYFRRAVAFLELARETREVLSIGGRMS